METHNSRGDENPELRDACDPYTIPFEGHPFYLTTEGLEAHTDKRDLKYQRFHYPEIKFISLQGGLLELSSTCDKVTCAIKLLIEKDKLQVSCSCGQEVYKLCAHGYNTIYRLILFKSGFYFEQYSRNGLVETAQAYSKYFTIKNNDRSIEIEPKPGTGKLYLSAESTIENVMGNMYPAETIYNIEVPEDIETGYAIIYPRGKSHPPFLLPWYGKLNRPRTEVKSFIDFIRNEKDMPAINLTGEQRALNSICLEMRKLAEELPVKLIQEPKYLPGFFPLFHLWEKALLLLSEKDFIHLYYVHLKFLKQRPRKLDMLSCKLHKERPQIKLKISRYVDLCKLTLEVTIDNKVVHYENEDLSFLLWIQNKGRHIYLLSSVKDAVMLEWIEKEGNSITVFKPHYSIFRDGLLKQLSEYYPVEFMHGKEREFNDIDNIYQLKPLKKQVQYSRQGKWIVLTPYVIYDNRSVTNALTKGVGWLAEKDGAEVFMQRDKQFENGFKVFIQNLHPCFINQNNTESFYLTHASFYEKNWGKKTETKLEKEGIETKGLETLQ
jgi:hypothetical protein